jgi:HEAT repeat protein
MSWQIRVLMIWKWVVAGTLLAALLAGAAYYVYDRNQASKRRSAVSGAMIDLESVDSKTRGRAVSDLLGVAMRGSEAQAAVPSLTKALSDPEGDIRATAAMALWAIGDTQAAPAIAAALGREGDKRVRSFMEHALNGLRRGVPIASFSFPIEAIKDVREHNQGSQ